MDPDVLCILAKEPRPGLVKTRLASAIGAEGAASLARAFLLDTVAMATRLGWARVVVALAGEAAGLSLPAEVEVWPQGPGDLGERMERALVRALAGAPRAILLGTDSPGLPPALVEAARAALTVHDAVLGPAEDGGFYLLGLRRCEPGLLGGLPWSRPDTLLHTEARLRHAGRSVAKVGPWFDIDEPADLSRLCRLVAAGEMTAPAVSQALARLGLLQGGPA